MTPPQTNEPDLSAAHRETVQGGNEPGCGIT